MAENDTTEQLKESLLCPITYQLLADPVVAPDGFTYERCAIVEWLEHNATSPLTRERMSISELTVNRKVVELLQQLKLRRQPVFLQDEASSRTTATTTGVGDVSVADATTTTTATIAAADMITQTASLRTVRPEAFTTLDELSDLIADATDAFQPPQVTVLGTESHGKSTILERLAGLPIFPRDKVLCTRVPVRVRFRRGRLQCIRMWEQPVDPRTGQPVGNGIDLLAQASFVAATRVLDRVRETMAQIMHALNEQRGQCGVSLEREIVIQLQGPTYPDIDLVDLPGLVEMAHEGEDPDMPQKTRDLSARYLQQHGDHSMFVVALECMTKMHTSAAVRLLKDNGVLDRSLGVLTKCDLFKAEDDDSDDDDHDDEQEVEEGVASAVGHGLMHLLSASTNRNYVETGFGWVLLVSKGLPRYNKSGTEPRTDSPDALLAGLRKCQAKESDFFARHNISMPDSAGIMALCRRVTRSFERYIHQAWAPTAIERIRLASVAAQEKLASLGVPFCADDYNNECKAHAAEFGDGKVDTETMKRRVRDFLIELIGDQGSGLFAISNQWLEQMIVPMWRALEDGANTTVATAAAFAASQSIRDATESAASADDAAVQLHPVAVLLKDKLAADTSEVRVGRFEGVLHAIAARVSTELGAWSQQCAAVVEMAATLVSGTFFDVPPDNLSWSRSAALVTDVLRRQLKRRPGMVVAMMQPVFEACRNDLKDSVGGVDQLVDRALSLAPDQDGLWTDANFATRHRVFQSLERARQAVDRLMLLVDESAARPDAISTDPARFETALGNKNVTEDVREALKSVFNGTCEVMLNLESKKIGNDGATVLGLALGVNATLERLYLENNDIGDPGAAALASALRRNTTLFSLHLVGNKIGDAGAAALGEALKINSSLRSLNLSKNEVGDAGAAALAEALEANTALKGLYLWTNHIGDTGTVALAEVLRVNQHIKKLYLTRNDVGDVGASAIGRALMNNSSLMELSISYNHIGDAGAASIGEALRVNATLQTLSLQSNGIGDDGAAALGQALQANTTLQTLNLGRLGGGNNIGHDGGMALATALQTNATLKTLFIADNPLSEDARHMLADAGSENLEREVWML